jgi:general L-amino acid transport system substrate-binding protein
VRSSSDAARQGIRKRSIDGALARPYILKGLIMKRLATALALVTALAFSVQAARSETLASIKERGELICGGNGTLAGFGLPDPQGNWTGFDVDFCRAIAAAIFNDPKKVKFVPLTAKDRFTALQAGDIDVLSRNTTWTLSRDTSLGLDFPAITYYDGQGFMVRRALKVSSALELNDASICVQQGTTSELNLADFFRTNHMGLKTVTFATGEDALKAYESGRCDAYTTDSSGLYGERQKLAEPSAHIVLPEIISKAPLSPAVRHGDNQWIDIVRCGRARHQQSQCRREAKIRRSGNAAPARRGRPVWRSDGPHQRLGVPDHQECRQLRRDFRAQSRSGLALEDRPRSQCAVDQGRAAIWSADSLTLSPPICRERADG